MEVNERVVHAVTVVSLVGDLDARTAPAAQERLTGVLPVRTPVLLDLSGVGYISSAGLRTLLVTYRRAQGAGTPIALTGLSPTLWTVLSATGFLRFFHVVDSVPDGVAALQPG